MSLATSSISVDVQPIFLVDTNVWIDWFLGFRRGHELTKKFLQDAAKHDIALAYASTSAKDIFFLIEQDCKINTRKQKGCLSESAAMAANQMAWACIETLNELAQAIGCDGSDVWIAKKHKNMHSDFEDNLVVAAAIRAKALALVTNDEVLIKHCPVAALDVADAISYIQTLD